MSERATETNGDGETLPFVRPTRLSSVVGLDIEDEPTEPGHSMDRYRWLRKLGAGGMGEVHLFQDGQLGREVAMKVMLPQQTPSGVARFVREAQLQGQLEHPSIVPVYDIARDADGRIYFTMKRIQGKTLRDVLDELSATAPLESPLYSRNRLLAMLSQLGQAVGFAHARGIVHRDLKPENIMLGDFGEIYVLDWGVARAGATASTASVDVSGLHIEQTVDGAIVGTPGYMSPEQALGDHGQLSPASDVYALGCILFEILTGSPAHPGATSTEWIVPTLNTPLVSPRERFPSLDVPPELDDICKRATAPAPHDRFTNASVFSRAVTDYLDGERNAELRATLARAHLAEAEAAIQSVTSGDGGVPAREHGLRELGRALALDPSDERALSLLRRVVLSASEDLPPRATDELKAIELADRRANNKRAIWHYIGWLAFAVFFQFWGTRNQLLNGALIAAIAALFGFGLWMSATGNVEPKFMRVVIYASFAITAATSVLLGPLLVVPGTAAIISAGFMVSLRANRETKWLLLALSIGSFALPFLLSITGIIPQAYAFRDGSLVVTSPLLELSSPGAAFALLLISGAAQQIAIFDMVGRATDNLVKAERRNFALAFRLRELLPGGSS